MAQMSLGPSIIKSLQLGEMHPDLPGSLLTQDRNKARNRTESKYWDYKQELPLADAYDVAEFARDVLSFHNTEGGLIAFASALGKSGCRTVVPKKKSAWMPTTFHPAGWIKRLLAAAWAVDPTS